MGKQILTITKSWLVLIICLVLLLIITACGGKQPNPSDAGATPASPTVTDYTPKPSSTKSASSTKAASQSVTKTTPTPTPKMNNVSFNLTLTSQQEYVEFPMPLYLKASQILHMNWTITKGGDHFYMTFTLPNGSNIAIRNNGTLSSYLDGETVLDELSKGGGLVLCPQDNDWENGYYLFHPQIHSGDAPVTINILYWIE